MEGHRVEPKHAPPRVGQEFIHIEGLMINAYKQVIMVSNFDLLFFKCYMLSF